MAKFMKSILSIIIGIFISVSIHAESCIQFSEEIEAAVNIQVNELRASEYCKARNLTSYEGIIIAIYTIKGACKAHLELTPGTCGNNWQQYMISSINGVVVPPLQVGGKSQLMVENIELNSLQIKVSGLTIGLKDALCCPSIPLSETYEISTTKFTKLTP